MKLSRLERFLGLFTDVRPGEGKTALLMFANVFLILCAYYFIKPLREGWIMVSEVAGLEQMEVKAYTYFGQILLLVLAIAWYSGLVNRWPRAKLITWATLFCMSNLVLLLVPPAGLLLRAPPGLGHRLLPLGGHVRRLRGGAVLGLRGRRLQ